MGMFDTVNYICPHCQEETDVQTKLGECCLDYWKLNDPTTLPAGEFRMAWACVYCNQYAVMVINENHVLEAIKADASDSAQQEVLYGNLAPLGTDPVEKLKEFADAVKKSFNKIKPVDEE